MGANEQNVAQAATPKLRDIAQQPNLDNATLPLLTDMQKAIAAVSSFIKELTTASKFAPKQLACKIYNDAVSFLSEYVRPAPARPDKLSELANNLGRSIDDMSCNPSTHSNRLAGRMLACGQRIYDFAIMGGDHTALKHCIAYTKQLFDYVNDKDAHITTKTPKLS